MQHMHHGPAFQALWRQLRTEVRALQDKGYYGDGVLLNQISFLLNSSKKCLQAIGHPELAWATLPELKDRV